MSSKACITCGKAIADTPRKLLRRKFCSMPCNGVAQQAAPHLRAVYQTPFYTAWVNLRKRCDEPKSPDYKNYGGRGISYDAAWQTFASFYNDMFADYKPGLSIDRVDNDGNYTKENCRWATRIEQSNNTRRNTAVTIDGVTKNIGQWIKERGLKSSTVHQRIHAYGWPITQALELEARR